MPIKVTPLSAYIDSTIQKMRVFIDTMHINTEDCIILGLICYCREKKKQFQRKLVVLMISIPVKRKVGRYLKLRRLFAGLTIEQASRKTGISSQIIHATEKARYSIPLCDMTSLIEIYGADRFDYVMFINHLGMSMHQRRRAIERFFGTKQIST